MLLADQDRALWDARLIARGRAALDRALALRGRGPYVLQAAIAALHADEPRDWPQIAALYGELARVTGSPVVELNRAVAVAEAEGPEAGLRIADGLDLDGYHYLHATRGELLRRLGRDRRGPRRARPRARARARRRRAPAARAPARRAASGLTGPRGGYARGSRCCRRPIRTRRPDRRPTSSSPPRGPCSSRGRPPPRSIEFSDAVLRFRPGLLFVFTP